jgi:hypothetical protein
MQPNTFAATKKRVRQRDISRRNQQFDLVFHSNRTTKYITLTAHNPSSPTNLPVTETGVLSVTERYLLAETLSKLRFFVIS